MNFFEDLIDELKEEQLLEETVIAKTDAAAPKRDTAEREYTAASIELSDESPHSQNSWESASPNLQYTSDEEPPVELGFGDIVIAPAPDTNLSANPMDSSDGTMPDSFVADEIEPQKGEQFAQEMEETEKFLQQLEAEELKRQIKAEVSAHVQFADDPKSSGGVPEPKSEPVTTSPIVSKTSQTAGDKPGESDYYRKRAIEEVASLQMVDNIFSNVEREQMKAMPKPYDDFAVKKILHSFLQVSGEVNSAEHAQAEFQLMQETESWYSALSVRDKLISVENLRYCCETTRPPLSAPALLALARFYRNSIFTEDVRNKFDLIATRLFSRDLEFGKREFVFSREELTSHLADLYLEWESLPPGEDICEDELTSMVRQFERFMSEARSANCFEDLIKSDFFSNFRVFKKSTEENFYVPDVAAAAIECNVSVGNRYLELLEKEQNTASDREIQEKYGILHDQLISNATSKTVQLADLLVALQQKPKPPEFDVTGWEYVRLDKEKAGKSASRAKGHRFGWLFGVNKYIAAAAIATALVTSGLYVWVEAIDTPVGDSSKVVQLDLTGLDFGEFVTSARISNESLFVISSPVWLAAPKEKKEEVLQKMVAVGKDRGYKKVHILDSQGKSIAAATQTRLDIK